MTTEVTDFMDDMDVKVIHLIDDVLVKEGGFVNHPADKGGATKYGITQQTLSRYLEQAVSIEDVKNLDIQTARDIYELRYYRMPRIDKLPQGIQHFVFDCAVNHGPKRAIRFVQQVCQDAGFGPVVVDGLMGPKAKSIANACCASMGIAWMLLALIEERRMFYLRIVERNPSQKVFLRGWLARANSFLPDTGNIA